MRDIESFRKILGFLNIDADSKAAAARLAQLIEPHLDGIIDQFYRRVIAFEINPSVNNLTIAALKSKQRAHWMALFHSNFDENFFNGIMRIGARHRDIKLDPMWYVAGYAVLKIGFAETVVKSDQLAAMKGRMLKALDQYVAVDMALSLSIYNDVALID